MTIFTRHAVARVRERTSMSLRDIKTLIDRNMAYPVGAEGSKTHFLIYSEVDEEWYIVVHDSATKEIVTVYYWQYHPRRCHFNISAQTFENAKRLAMGLPIASLADIKKESDKEQAERAHKAHMESQKEAARWRKTLPKFSIWAGDTKLVGINVADINTWMKQDKEYFASVMLAIIGAIKNKRITKKMLISYSPNNSDKEAKTPYPELADVIAQNNGYDWMKTK